MVEKMNLISITGPRELFDHVLDSYLSKHEIQLENALTELKSVPGLRPFTEPNPYREILATIDALLSTQEQLETERPKTPPSEDALIALIEDVSKKVHETELEKKQLTQKLAQLTECAEMLRPYQVLEPYLAQILAFDFIDYRFGRIPIQYYRTFKDYIDHIDDALFYKCETTDQYVFGVYFVPTTKKDRIDSIFASLHFETISLQERIPEEFKNAEDPYTAFEDSINQINYDLQKCNQKSRREIDAVKNELVYAKQLFETYSEHFDVRKYAALLKTNFILCGWMTAKDAKAFIKETENDPDISVMFEDGETDQFNTPPTKLKNPRFFQPFQMYVRMYGMPAQNEMDPTIFVALTYMFIFGWMFGDVGQGALLCIGGFALYHFKKMDLAGIIGCCGIFSMLFGFLFGSFFGFEDVLPALWMRPISKMSQLPFIGRLNTVFVVAIAFGMLLNLVVMIINIVNSIRAKDMENAIFSQNGVVGFVFYAALATVIFLYMSGRKLPATIVLVIMFVIPLLLLALKEPICNKLKKREKLIEEGAVMFGFQTFFELFEILLSYFSNTLSFVRVGAFAVSHAAMMEVVLMLAGATDGSPNWIVIVLGNLFVCGLEGLIVGIQVLRLEYYELFSRFYRGTGREFVPYKQHNTKENETT